MDYAFKILGIAVKFSDEGVEIAVAVQVGETGSGIVAHIGQSEGIVYTIPSKSTVTKAYTDHAKWKEAPPFKKTTAMDEGSLLDILLLTPQFMKRDVVKKKYDAFRSNEAKAWRDKMYAEAPRLWLAS